MQSVSVDHFQYHKGSGDSLDTFRCFMNMKYSSVKIYFAKLYVVEDKL